MHSNPSESLQPNTTLTHQGLRKTLFVAQGTGCCTVWHKVQAVVHRTMPMQAIQHSRDCRDCCSVTSCRQPFNRPPMHAKKQHSYSKGRGRPAAHPTRAYTTPPHDHHSQHHNMTLPYTSTSISHHTVCSFLKASAHHHTSTSAPSLHPQPPTYKHKCNHTAGGPK